MASELQTSSGMNAQHRKMLEQEIGLARALMGRGNLDGAFVHLERAHVLGQRHVRWHVLTHWLMLQIAIRRHQGISAAGQAARIVLGAIGSALGRVPTGNTGGSDVSMFARLPISPDLLSVMSGSEPRQLLPADTFEIDEAGAPDAEDGRRGYSDPDLRDGGSPGGSRKSSNLELPSSDVELTSLFLSLES